MTINALHTLKAERAVLHSQLMQYEDLQLRLATVIENTKRKEAALTASIETLMRVQHFAATEFGTVKAEPGQ